PGQWHFFTIPFSSRDLNDAAPHDVKRHTRIPLFIDVLTVSVCPFMDNAGKPLKISLRQILEEMHLLEEIDKVVTFLACRAFRSWAEDRTRLARGNRQVTAPGTP